MPEGILCNRTPINTKEQLDATLGDKGGKQYYEEMKQLDVDVEKLQKSLQDTCKSRIRTWLEMCAHCGLCADTCFFYLANRRDPTQVPSYKILTTLGEIVKKNGNVTTTTCATAWMWPGASAPAATAAALSAPTASTWASCSAICGDCAFPRGLCPGR